MALAGLGVFLFAILINQVSLKIVYNISSPSVILPEYTQSQHHSTTASSSKCKVISKGKVIVFDSIGHVPH